MATSGGSELQGTLHRVPFLGTDLAERTAPIYRDLVGDYGLENVLVLKRFPTDVDSIATTFAEAVESIEQPSVVGLTQLAVELLADLPDPPRRLSQSESNLLLGHFLRTHDWETPYLERAAAHQSFEFDVRRFISAATWQGQSIETDDPVLAELAAVKNAYHDWLDSADALDGSRVLQYVTDVLANETPDTLRTNYYDAVLVLEFEEFTPIDRAFVQQVTADADTRYVAEANSAIQRTWNEPGDITDYTSGLTVNPVEDSQPESAPDAIATFLATGDGPPLPGVGNARILETPTFDDQLFAIADEIERLRRGEGVTYDEMAVVLRDSNAPIPETLRGLRAAGIPVSSATVGGLEHDPAARELFALVSWCARHATNPGDPAEASIEPGLGWERERARSVLGSRVPDRTDRRLARICEQGETDGLQPALTAWVLETDLKDRIANSTDPLATRTQFQHVSDALSLAGAIDRSELVPASWSLLCRGLQSEMERAASDKIATTLDLPDGGVLVDAVRVVKNTSREVVFMPGVVDREYPASPRFNNLFPTPHLEQLEAYPAFTSPTAADVSDTFPTAPRDSTRPLHDYYASLSRRLLAVGTRAASRLVYYGVYAEDRSASSSRLQPSRFLTAIEDVYGDLDRVETEGIHSHGAAVRAAIDRVDTALDGVRRAGLVDDPIHIDDVRADFAAIQSLLDAGPPADLEAAIGARVDFAEGVVRRE